MHESTMSPRRVSVIGGAAMALVVAVIAVAGALSIGAHHVHADNRRPTVHNPGNVTAHLTATGTVLHDPYCAAAEDDCRINYRPSGAWVIRRVHP